MPRRQTRLRLPYSFVCLAAALFALATTGCPDQSAKQPELQTPPVPPAVEKFEHIVTDLERVIVTSNPWQNRDRDMSGGGSTEFSYELKHKLIPPDEGVDIYRAAVTITKRYRIVAYPKRGPSDDGSADEEGSTDDALLEGGDLEELYDPAGEALASSGVEQAMSIPAITTLEDEDVKTFHLEFQDGRWVQITETDKKTETAIQEAFDYALRRQ